MAAPTRIQINLISKDTLDKMTTEERLRFIITEVKLGKVLILEHGLTASEQFELNKLTMSEIDHESFIGIEMPGFSADYKKPSFVDRIFRRRKTPRMMAIGPAKLMKIIKKDPSFIQTIVTPGEGGEFMTGEGIPIEYNQIEPVPEALPVKTEPEIPESQARLDQFETPIESAEEEGKSREELEMLIGPELREEPPTAPRTTEDTSPTTPEQTYSEGAGPLSENQAEETVTRGPGEVRNSTSGFVYKKLKDDSEER
ncbi:MAG: DUF2073 domain-containing protein [Thermoplasmata archaeon]|nr:MAG: DUF2073 domain-containing protein [Thermoplasmata archaeon]